MSEVKDSETKPLEKRNNPIVLPQKLVSRIIRVAELKARCNGENGSTNQAYREWSNAGYSIYNDRG